MLELWQAHMADKLQPEGLQASKGTHTLCRQEKRTRESRIFAPTRGKVKCSAAVTFAKESMAVQVCSRWRAVQQREQHPFDAPPKPFSKNVTTCLAVPGQGQQQVAHTQQAAWWHHSHVVEADEAKCVPREPGAGHANAI